MSEGASDTATAAAIRILVPLDGSPEASAALPYAAALATPGTEIVLLTVTLQRRCGCRASRSGDRRAAPARGGTDGARRSCGRQSRATHRRHGSRPGRGHDRHGLAWPGRDGAPDLRQRSRPGGSRGDVPVMVVRARQVEPGPVGITRLVVPLDGSPLAEAALPVATAISRRLGTPLFLVRAVDPADLMPPAVGMGEAIPFEIYDEAEKEMEQEARHYLERWRRSCASRVSRWRPACSWGRPRAPSRRRRTWATSSSSPPTSGPASCAGCWAASPRNSRARTSRR